MSKPKQPVKTQATTPPKAAAVADQPRGFSIPYPMLLLALVPFLLYYVSFSFGLTELDDSIFILDFHKDNENLNNLVNAFQRGLFDPVKDPYYRPLFMDSMILNYQWSDAGHAYTSYHVINVLLHIGATLLLYNLFINLNVKKTHAFILALIFAVHPVLSQAVAWIPGRNDTMLAIFIFSFSLFAISYTRSGKASALVASTLFLLLAFFTKETAVFAPPVAFLLLILVLRKPLGDKKMRVQYITWAACFGLWYMARAAATIQTGISASQVFHDLIPRLPVIPEYLGKIFFPVNLSVFPILKDTVIYYGIGALLLLIMIILLCPRRDYRIILAGLGIFVLFLLPALLVPSSLNDQMFEHRLYLPIVGILLLLPQTILLNNKLGDRQLVIGGTVLAAVFCGTTYLHEQQFKDPVTFWQAATESSPHSAYAKMMLAARLKDDKESFRLFREAYALNPHEKYLNFYYGVMLQKQDSVMQSEKYLLTEKNTSNYFECDFYLARVDMQKKDYTAAIMHLQNYLKTDVANSIANTNLLLLYIDTKQPDKAREQIRHMRQNGVQVPPALAQQLGV